MNRGGVTWGVLPQGQVFVCSCRHTRGGTPPLAPTHTGAGLQPAPPRPGDTPDPGPEPPAPPCQMSCLRPPVLDSGQHGPRGLLLLGVRIPENQPHTEGGRGQRRARAVPCLFRGRPGRRRAQHALLRQRAVLAVHARGPWGSVRPRPCWQAGAFLPRSEALRPAQGFQMCTCCCSKSEEGRKNLKAWSQLGFIF